MTSRNPDYGKLLRLAKQFGLDVTTNTTVPLDLLLPRKDDDGKDPWHLAPWDAFRAIVSVMRHGADKYGERNWEAGLAYSRLFSATQRHLSAWWEGEGTDAETGMSHLWHAGCCVMFLISYQIRGVGIDDRPLQRAA